MRSQVIAQFPSKVTQQIDSITPTIKIVRLGQWELLNPLPALFFPRNLVRLLTGSYFVCTEPHIGWEYGAAEKTTLCRSVQDSTVTTEALEFRLYVIHLSIRE
ncbi:MAG: hypothetical protein V4723_22265 [Pseudomonadota bacterium]